MWYPLKMPAPKPVSFRELYSQFYLSITEINCGDKCSPYNELGVPFCCDTQHAVPTAYREEWNFLSKSTDLWHLWKCDRLEYDEQLRSKTPTDHILIECQGHQSCQRSYRTMTCRSFPFFPYVNREGEFIGLTYYWEYEDRCWIISNLSSVSDRYREQFVHVYDIVFSMMPDEKENFRHYSIVMRRIFGRKRRTIPLLHRNGNSYKVTPGSGKMRRVHMDHFPIFGNYRIAAQMPFPDEVLD